jgi:hypothetical protein
MVRCHRCRRVLGRLSAGWFQPKRVRGQVKDSLPPVFTFPGQPKPFVRGKPMKGVNAIPLGGWTLAGVACGCRKRDGTRMLWTLNLHKMYHASRLDKRIHDLVAGMPDYGLVGIHDDLDYAMRLDKAPGSISHEEATARGPSDASTDALMRRIHDRARRKTWRVAHGEATTQTVSSPIHRDTGDPVDRA